MKMSSKANINSTRAVALIIVLAMLVLLSGLIVAFMSTVTTEHGATQSYANAATARQIADNTTNFAIGQIREATTLYTEKGTWASQPGAIRVFMGKQSNTQKSLGTEGGYQYAYSGPDDVVYKLYSSENMRVKGTDYQPAGTGMKDELAVIKNWPTAPDKRFVDLNEPVLTPRTDLSTATKQYVDPRYPIIDPRASFKKDETVGTPGIVEGFAATTSKLLSAASTVVTLGGQPVPALPMPAQWLYVLRDGTILGPDALSKLGNAVESNPVVGRTAFWVDDESCKVNLNTASEGTFWDTPSVATEQESGNVSATGAVTSSATSLSLAASQPARGEYQRYPGHPATTCLSPVLGWLWDLPVGPLTTRDSKYVAFKNAIFQISPYTPAGTVSGSSFLGEGSSLGGTDNPDVGRPDGKGMSTLADNTPKLKVLTKHLYANADEFIFQPDRNTGGASPKTLVNPNLTPQALEKVRFFLTANSRAPELNVFNRPRITFWPVSKSHLNDPASTTRRTNFDNLFTFTSTIGGKPFSFVRSYARDSQADINLTENLEMFKYLQWLTGDNGRAIPGFGSTFKDKYSFGPGDGRTERNQILLLIFDYMRSVNLVDTGTGKIGANRFISYTPFFGGGQAGYGGVADRSFDWSGQVTPAGTNLTHPLGAGLQGLGRFCTLREAALLFTRAGPLTDSVPPVTPAVKNQKNMQATLLFEMATPMPGYPAIRQTFWTRVRAGSKQPDGTVLPPPRMKVGSNPLIDILPAGTPLPATYQGLPSWDNVVNISTHEIGNGRAFMPTLGFINQLYYFPEHKNFTYPELYPSDPNFTKTIVMTRKKFDYKELTNIRANTRSGAYTRNVSITYYPYVSDLAPIADATGKLVTPFTFELTEGWLEVEIWNGEAPGDPRAGDKPVQTITLRFPSVTLNIPDGTNNTAVDYALRPAATIADKDDASPAAFRAIDQIRSLEYVGGEAVRATKTAARPYGDPQLEGDLRLSMMRPVLGPDDFAPRDWENWKLPALKLVHGLRTGWGAPMAGFDQNAKPSVMAAGGTQRGGKPFLLPVGANGVRGLPRTTSDTGRPGDYDRGLSKHVDGSFGGKVDEGNVFYGYGDNNDGGRLPYFRGRAIEETGQSFFTPNRQLPSAVMFGSLPSGGLEGRSWETLLFRPDRPAKLTTPHPGARLPEDHLLLDLFHLPIIEPYAISEPFSTAGKINLNYIMAPYGYAPGTGTFGKDKVANAYIRRDTGLRAVMKSVKIMAVDTTAGDAAHTDPPVPVGAKYRFDIDLDNTISKIEQRFMDKDRGLFRSASEICTVDLFPIGKAVTTWNDFWETQNAQTGDNMRERPYAHIYPRVTTKSNVFTIHMRCQTVQQSQRKKGESYAFDETRDRVLAEYRGSSIIERFVDPNDPDLANYDYKKTSVDPYYRFRVVDTKHFSPR